jgi:hypothetical protein
MMRSLLTAIGSLAVGICILLATSQFVSLAATNEMDCGSDAVIDVARKIANGHPDNKLAAHIHYQSTPTHSGAVKALEDEEREKEAAFTSVNDAAQKKMQDALRKLQVAKEECAQTYSRIPFLTMMCSNNASAPAYKNAANTGPNSIGSPEVQRALQHILETIRPLEEQAVKAQLEARSAIAGSNNVQPIRNSYAEKLNRLWDAAKNNISYDLDTIRMKARDADTGRLTCQAVMTAQLPEWGSAKMDVAFTVEKTTKGELYVEIYGLE